MEGGEEEPPVGHRWTRKETVVLANALKTTKEEADDVPAKSAVGTASDKCESVSKFCRSRVVTRSSAPSNSRWNKGLASGSTHSHHSDGAVRSMSNFARLQATTTTGQSLQSLKSQIGEPPGQNKKPVISGQTKKRASLASAGAVLAIVSLDGRAKNGDTPNMRPITDFTVPLFLDIR